MAIKKAASSFVGYLIALAIAFTPTVYAQERYLIPVGSTVGIEMKTDGVMVAGLSTPTGCTASPAGESGISAGDFIIKFGNLQINSAVELISAIRGFEGGEVSLTFRRGDLIKQATVKPALSPEGFNQLGLLLRDSVSGIGTVTFIDPETGMYGALGHAITDVDNGLIMPLSRGEILDSSVVDVRKGSPGTPGELCGSFDSRNKRGNIVINTEKGIFGFVDDNDSMRSLSDPMPIAGDIRPGAATILSNVRGKEIGEYSVEITRVYRNDEKGRSLMLTVTDPKLLEITGDIVQGMSGSPIIQDGKLIGAVTHVLINDPTRGYGVSIENMLAFTQGDIMRNAARQ